MKTYIIVPITIPGMNKSAFCDTFKATVERNGWKFSMLSNKEIKKQCAEEFKRNNKNKNLSEEIIKAKSEGRARSQYNKKFEELLQARNVPWSCKAYFIYLEKNHPPNAFNKLFTFINANKDRINPTIIALTPLLDPEDYITYENKGDSYSYPLSFNLFMTCFDRVQKRKNHQTLSGSGSESARANIHFLSLFENCKFNEEDLKKYRFDKNIRIPFTQEDDPTKIPTDLKESIFKALNNVRESEYTIDEIYFKDLNDIYEKHKLQFKDPDVNAINDYIQDFIEREIKPEVIPGYVPRPNNITIPKSATKPKVEERKIEEKKEEEALTQPQEIQYSYKPTKKIPAYFGIFPSKNSRPEFKSYITERFKLLASAFPEDQSLISAFEDIQQDKPQLPFVDDPHVMTSYIGGNEEKYKECYKDFKRDYRLDLELFGLVIVPNKIVIALCYPDQSVIKIEDEFPHMILMKGEWSSQSSDIVLEKLFGEGGPLSLDYQSKKLGMKKEFTRKVNIEISDWSATAYVVIQKDNIVHPAETRASNKASL